MISSDFLLLQISGLPNNTFLTDLMTMVEAEVRNYGLIIEMTIGKFIEHDNNEVVGDGDDEVINDNDGDVRNTKG